MQTLQRPVTRYEKPAPLKKEPSLFLDKTVLTCSFLACATAIGLAIKPRPTEKLGLDQLRHGNFSQAASTLEQAIKADGPTLDAYIGLARAYNHMMMYPQGLASAERALQFHQVEATAWAEHATANLGLLNYRAALADAEQALSIDSANSRATDVQEKATTMLAANR